MDHDHRLTPFQRWSTLLNVLLIGVVLFVLLLLVLGGCAWGETPWASTTNYEGKLMIVVVREEYLQEALRQFTGEKSCTGVSEWTYELYLQREDAEQPGRWVTDEKLKHTGKVKLCTSGGSQ